MCYKLALLVRSDIKMSKGKTVAQCGHAVVDATLASIKNNTILKWKDNGETIIALKVKNEKTLLTIINIAERKNVPCGYITDEGLTEVPHGTITVGFIGPDKEEKVNKLTGQLKLV